MHYWVSLDSDSFEITRFLLENKVPETVGLYNRTAVFLLEANYKG